jgi:hypothetical protein
MLLRHADFLAVSLALFKAGNRILTRTANSDHHKEFNECENVIGFL